MKRMNAEIVSQIRSEPRKGPGGRGGTGSGLTLKELAKKYNTTYRNIRAIIDGETHVNNR